MARILVVDDELEVRESVRKILALEGLEVVSVPSAAQALEAVFREPFDLVLLDLALADASGISVLEKIRESQSRVPVVVYSGALTAERETAARAAGANEVLRKDIGPAQLVAQIKKIIKVQDRIARGGVRRIEKPILIVDDEEGLRFMLKGYLETKGYRVLEAENGERALELVRSQKVAVVLLDIQMPGMDGLTTLQKLMAIDPKLGVVMVTAMQGDARVKKAIALGAYGYVLKPFDFLYLDFVVMSRLGIAESD